MKSTGITRPVDMLGRVVIPMEIREHFGIHPKDLLEIFVQGDKIILKKYGEDCTFCGAEENLVELEGKYVCKACLEKLCAANTGKED